MSDGWEAVVAATELGSAGAESGACKSSHGCRDGQGSYANLVRIFKAQDECDRLPALRHFIRDDRSRGLHPDQTCSRFIKSFEALGIGGDSMIIHEVHVKARHDAKLTSPDLRSLTYVSPLS